jgi:NADPH2:quinone reductase
VTRPPVFPAFLTPLLPHVLFTMKAIRVEKFGEPEVLRLVDVPELIPNSGQVVVRVEAAGVNPVETYIRSGNYAHKPALSYTPGSDAAGVVTRVGDTVKHLREGQRVYVAGSQSGTYAEQTLCAAAQAHPLPSSISSEQGAALGVPYVTASFALFHRAQARAGETVLLHGATGGVGIAALQLALAGGLTTLATGGSDAGRMLLKHEGAHTVFDHKAPGYIEAIMEATEGRGVDVILEVLANVNLGMDLQILAPDGRVVVVGSRGPVEINPRDLMSRNADVRGVFLAGASAPILKEIHAALYAGLDNGTLRPVIGREFPLAQAAEAHRAIMAPGAMGKIVLTP